MILNSPTRWVARHNRRWHRVQNVTTRRFIYAGGATTVCADTPRNNSPLPYRCHTTKTDGLRFRAVLSKDGTRRVELVRTWRKEARRGPLCQSLEHTPQVMRSVTRPRCARGQQCVRVLKVRSPGPPTVPNEGDICSRCAREGYTLNDVPAPSPEPQERKKRCPSCRRKFGDPIRHKGAVPVGRRLEPLGDAGVKGEAMNWLRDPNLYAS
jgi:hypothetical protein